jgi:hypothetical protein
MASESGHAPSRAYFGRDGTFHLNGATLWLQSGTKIDTDDATAVTLNQLLAETVAEGLTATGTTQATALALTADINRLTTVGANSGVLLPPSLPGLTVIVINHGANPVQVYGAGTDTIDDVATATGVAQMVNSVCLYSCTLATKWYAEGLGSGYAGAFPTVSYTEGITAGTTQTQAGGTPITTALNRVTTANTNDGVTLPVSAPGMQVTVINASANTIKVYPNAGGTGTEQINAVGANAAYTIATVKSVSFYCTLAGQWHTILTA